MEKTIQPRPTPDRIDTRRRSLGTEDQRFEFRVHRDGNGLQELEKEWVKLEASIGSPYLFFQSYLWVSTWWRHFSKTGKFSLIILTARRNRELVLVWPMAIAKRGMLNILEPAGGHLSCFGNALVADDSSQQALVKLGLKKFRSIEGIDGIHFAALPEKSAVFHAMTAEEANVISWGASPEIQISESSNFEAYLRSRSKGLRKELRSIRRRLETVGFVEQRTNDPTLTVPKAVAAILQFKRDWIRDKGLRKKTVTSSTGETFLADFCERYRILSSSGQLRIDSLAIDESLVACGIAFQYFGQQIEYIGGFDHEFRDYGVGKLQLESSISDAFKSGCRSCNLLTPASEFKSRWTDNATKTAQVFVPVSPLGWIHRNAYLKWLRPKLKAFYLLIQPQLTRWFC